MDFWNYITTREAYSKAGSADPPDAFYKSAMADAVAMRSAQFLFQLRNERDWEQARRPYYDVWPSIVPMRSGSGMPKVLMPDGCRSLVEATMALKKGLEKWLRENLWTDN